MTGQFEENELENCIYYSKHELTGYFFLEKHVLTIDFATEIETVNCYRPY